ncbi:sensor domain-containing diguanylate cyclase [Cellulomonas cellasea]|uniref:Diguanylate cyclase (GGDEF)-like protein/PAS domain S-box-containing protein n=1 Tax=Cellulomonas cellasea TaxID=43670 RepID=A0A7W4YCE6_9CELL|nr:sensor domain-containing diguanylate cyclase [Cellulomonas cellasea]MBB2923486.1 diguanylate cyclase (GGDEF)-like protein/PAS domain S-box-containing protein [Cellulomonas cellasea]
MERTTHGHGARRGKPAAGSPVPAPAPGQPAGPSPHRAPGSRRSRANASASRVLARIPLPLAVVGTLVVALPVLLALHAQGWVLGSPWVLTGLVLLQVVLLSDRVERLVRRTGPGGRPLLTLAVAFTLVAAFAWTAGWSALVPATTLLVAVAHVQRSGSRVWPHAGAAVTLLTLAGQGATQLGWVATALPVWASHVAAGWLLLVAWLTLADVGLSVAADASVTDALARTEARLRALMDSATDVLTVSDAHGVLTYVSPAAERTTGHPAESLTGTYLLDLVRPEHRAQAARQLRDVMAVPGARRTVDVPLTHADGESRWYEWNVHNLLADPLVQGLVVDQRDVTDRRYQEEQLTHAASHDDLTGLPNRRELLRLLGLGLRAVGPGAALAVLFVDLDRFKAVNDTYGHAAGDEVLIEVGRRLRTHLRHGDVLARLGGDEFGAVLVEVRDDVEITELVARLEETVARPIRVTGGVVSVGVSIGAAVTTDPATEPTTLFTRADTAMYRIKHVHRATRGAGEAGTPIAS